MMTEMSLDDAHNCHMRSYGHTKDGTRLRQKVADSERMPSSGPRTQFLVCLCQKSAEPPKGRRLVDGARCS